MKKALKVVGAYAVLFVVCIIIAGFGDAAAGAAAAIFMVAILVGIIALPVCLIRKSRRKENKPETAPQEERQPVVQAYEPPVTPVEPVAPVESSCPHHPCRNVLTLPTVHGGYGRSYSYNDVQVCVINPQLLAVENVSIGDALEVWQEKTNEYDNKAVALSKGQSIVAYLYKNNRLQGMANDWLDASLPVLAKVASVEGGDLAVMLAFYGNPREPKRTAYKLTRTTSAAVQEEIACCSEGCELWLEEDDNGDYIATRWGDPVGKLPAAAIDMIDRRGGIDGFKASVAEIGYTDSGKYTISIHIYK